MVKLFQTLSALFLATLVAADLKVIRPASDIWWVAKSLNEIAWTCHDTTIENFTVLINNKDPKILTAPIAVIAIQQNFQCSITITQDQANQPVGTGWTVVLANPLNNTDVYARSEEFEIKPLGSLYPSQVSSSAGAPGGSSTGSASASQSTSGATSFDSKTGVVAAAAAMVMGAFGFLA